MKKEITKKVVGYELLRKGIPSGLVREFWTGSPWRAFQSCIRGV